MFTPISDHQTEAKARLITQYRESGQLRGLVGAIVKPIQAIEDALVQLNTQRQLDTATGVNLDRLGDILGFPRPPGDSDALYRQKLLARVKINTSQGEPERVIETFKLFTGATQVQLYEGSPAEIHIASEYVPPDQATVDLLLGIIEEILPAGVRCGSIVVFDPTETFAFEGDLPGLGFDDDATPGSGGKFAAVWTRNGYFEFEGDDPKGEGYGSNDDPLVGGWLSDV